VLRGLHFQRVNPQGKLLTVLTGAVWDVAVDIRPDSPTRGEWVGVELSAETGQQIWVPPGFAHGFCVVRAPVVVQYFCTTRYDPEAQGGIRWDDPDLGITWPVDNPHLSDRDRSLSSLAEVFGN
jgi:dTDP-4-dehydrorhamnose 3,5-epimerase